MGDFDLFLKPMLPVSSALGVLGQWVMLRMGDTQGGLMLRVGAAAAAD